MTYSKMAKAAGVLFHKDHGRVFFICPAHPHGCGWESQYSPQFSSQFGVRDAHDAAHTEADMDTTTTKLTHADLHASLRELGWREDVRADGTRFFYAPIGIVDHAIQTIAEDPEHALVIERDGKRVCTSIEEARAFARAR